MIQFTDKNGCCGCSACYNICPNECISLEKDDEGFLYPSIDPSSCVNCGLCEMVCPQLLNGPSRKKKPLCFAAKNKDKEVLSKSSSGGVFSAFSEETLNKNGVVYGVGMSSDFKTATFVRVAEFENLRKVRGSKYLQADAGKAFKEIENDLKNGKTILFSGVPCQINGLKMYLKKDYQNLFTVETLCHGVPSPKLWQKYLCYLEEKNRATVTEVNFREKKTKGISFGLRKEGLMITQFFNRNTDPYLVMFNRDLSLRPSCYHCKAKNLESMADVTIADFWGIENVLPKIDDEEGVSLVFVHNDKGTEAIRSIKEKVCLYPAPFDESVKHNPSYFSSPRVPVYRDEFFCDLDALDFDHLRKKYCRMPLSQKIKKAIKNTFMWRLSKRIIKRGMTESRFDYGLLIRMSKIEKD